MTKPVKLIIDIMLVIAVSALTFVLEGIAIEQQWINPSPALRGVSSVLAGAAAAAGLVLARGGSFADLGFRPPGNWLRVTAQVAVILIAFILAQRIAPLLVSAFVEVPKPDFSRYDEVTGNLSLAITMALIMPLTASIPEEIIYRGFLMGRLADIFGDNLNGSITTVLIQAVMFGSVHFLWGMGGILVTTIMGLVWGSAYLLSGRNLWVVIIAHSTGHVLFVTQLYLGTSIII